VALGCSAKAPPKTDFSRESRSTVGESQSASAEAPAPGGGQAQKMPSSPGGLERKIIYTANVDLVVESFEGVPAKVEALTQQFGGYVARTKISGSPGRPRSGEWSLRVPVVSYAKFLAAAQQLGEVRSVSQNSQDVSEEYYDVEARIRNAKKEEERLLKLLDTAAGKLQEILQVERELARVRGEIEQMEGRIRVLDNLTALTTVDLRIDEIKNYVPEEAPTYATRVRRTWGESTSALVTTAQGLSIALVALVPWLVVLLPAALVVWLAARLARRRRR